MTDWPGNFQQPDAADRTQQLDSDTEHCGATNTEPSVETLSNTTAGTVGAECDLPDEM